VGKNTVKKKMGNIYKNCKLRNGRKKKEKLSKKVKK